MVPSSNSAFEQDHGWPSSHRQAVLIGADDVGRENNPADVQEQ
jgi:hypothetical protein